MSNTLAEVFPPGEYLRDVLETNNWTQEEFAEIIGKSYKQVNELLSGRATLTAPMAQAIAAALDTSPEVWLGLENAYRLSLSEPVSTDIERRARLRATFPVRELQKRGWIPKTESIEELEASVCQFYEIEKLSDSRQLAHAAKRTSYSCELTTLQEAVLRRVRALARHMQVAKYDERKLRTCIDEMRLLMREPEEIRHVPKLLAAAGVRFVICEAFPSSKMDGLCTWLGEATPVIAMTLRLDRIDNFWFVLRHECEHVLRRDGFDEASGGAVIDDDIGSVDSVKMPAHELAANAAAAEFVVPQDRLADFIARVGPLFSKSRLIGFAETIGVHPGIVVGQLQRALGRWDLFRPLQIRIRPIITATALTDGFGNVIV